MSAKTDTYSIALYQLTHPSIDAVTKKQAQDFLWAELVALAATVAALTAENAQLRETLTLGLGEQESVIAGLRAVNERLRSALATLLAVAPPPIAGRNDYAAARDAARAADDSPSREDAHAALTALCAGAYGPKGGRKDYLFHLSSYHALVLMQLFDNLEAKCRQNRLAADPTPAAPDQAEGPQPDDIAELRALADKFERETQVFLGYRNAERADLLRRTADELARLRAREIL